jgi:AcrR family transcriptional regulator
VMTDSRKARGKQEEPRKTAINHQKRALQTRRELIEAARTIFARDGFAVARLQDIAEAAGKTRGALYDNFKDKEDLFFAIITEDVSRDYELYYKQLRVDSTYEERVRVLTKKLVALVQDRQRMLLQIEFKLFALRHPARQERLAELHAAVCYQGGLDNTLVLIPELRSEDPVVRRRALTSFGAILDGLALNLYFDPVGSRKSEIRRKIEREVRERLGGDPGNIIASEPK